MKRGGTFEYVRDGCATYMRECPNGDEAITVRRVGQTLTECVRRGDVTLTKEEPDA